jgi:hypothetical protein
MIVKRTGHDVAVDVLSAGLRVDLKPLRRNLGMHELIQGGVRLSNDTVVRKMIRNRYSIADTAPRIHLRLAWLISTRGVRRVHPLP